MLAPAVGVLVLWLPWKLPIQTRALAAWNVTVLVFLVLICLARDALTTGHYEETAASVRQGKTSALAAVMLVCVMAVAATAATLNTVQRHQAGALIHANFSLLSVLSSWFLLQVMFALFYGRYYHLPVTGANGKTRKGLEFATDDAPDFWDFVYFSFTVGITYATSDTNVTSRMLRRAVLLQSVISFLFYTVIIGLVINAVLQIL
ncbi:MAG: DUF1345 domain-containing protein [Longimicrobiales bacterium]